MLTYVGLVILSSLRAPERDLRLEEIEEKFRNTFDWIYDRPEPRFTQWLEKGTGLFWINGKPGSGKSTLMKFLFKDQRTSDLLQDWKTGNAFTRVAFFFHYRGTSMQKSFEGLLRSVLSQIISERPELCRFLRPMFKHQTLTSENWTLPILQRGLHTILTQDEEPLHLCLFLDAIDEYGGRLESICQFLEDLGKIRPKPNKLIKVCFSSRPWDIFLRTFKCCPGFRIHDFTREDIGNYCLGSLKEERLPPVTLENLIPYLVTRSRGVFLWVKLVVKDLAKAAGVTRMRATELERLLESYPTELDTYYIEIIERIPHIHRWKAYAMLEVAVRSKHTLSPKYFVGAVCCSESRTYEEANSAVENLSNRGIDDFVAFVSMESKKYCGGLIEVLLGTEGYYIQVLHQTVEDFVMGSKFKQLVLGDRSRITVENGNAFLSKYYLLTATTSERGEFYARNAEKTSGRSLKTFLDSMPSPLLRELYSTSYGGEIATPLAYAVSAGLRLYIIESVAANPNLLRESKEPLLHCVIKPGTLPPNDGFFHMAKLLLDRGFILDQDPTAFNNLLLKIYISKDSYLSEFFHATTMDSYVRMAELLLNHGQDPNVDITIYDEDGENFRCKPLHICPPSLVRILLDKGASVNASNSKKKTPLDQCGYNKITDGNHLPGTGDSLDEGDSRKLSLLEAYQMTCLLVSRGGTIQKLRRSDMKLRLAEFESRGWPTEEIRAHLFPRQTLRETIVSKFKRMSSSSGRA